MIGILSNKGKQHQLIKRIELEFERFEHYCVLYKRAQRMQHKKLEKLYRAKALRSYLLVKKLAKRLKD
jgi:hypothetical protein